MLPEVLVDKRVQAAPKSETVSNPQIPPKLVLDPTKIFLDPHRNMLTDAGQDFQELLSLIRRRSIMSAGGIDKLETRIRVLCEKTGVPVSSLDEFPAIWTELIR